MGLWDRLRERLHPPGEDDPDLPEALERAAYRVEPRIKQVRGWPKRYLRPIAGALAQARRVAAGIPGPVTLEAGHYASDPYIHAIFGSAEAIGHLFRTSPAAQAYVGTALESEAYALLSAIRQEKRVLGMEIDGDILRREVPQTQVWFTDHQLHGLAKSEAEAREGLLWTLFDRFLERVAVGVERLRAERERLSQEKDLARARLRGASAASRPSAQGALEGVMKQLTDTIQALELENLHEVFETVLSHPQDCLYLRPHDLILDALGTVHTHPGEGASRIEFVELWERYQTPRTVALVHCRGLAPADPGARLERLDAARRWLG
jgi:hypothetical protein